MTKDLIPLVDSGVNAKAVLTSEFIAEIKSRLAEKLS